uniref:Si:dkey-30c15.2 n=1 Tax=Amphiprion percula TaxID=161767 RepID=A0A3P8T048_AMPPE
MTLNGTLNGHQIDVLSNVYIAFLIPSLIGSFSILAVSIFRWRRLKEQVHLLVQLALADLLAALILMCTSIMNKVTNDRRVEICQYSLPLSLTFYLISFLLAVVYAWKSKNAIQGWRDRAADDEAVQSRCRLKIVAFPVYVIVWLIPIAMYLAYVLTNFITTAMVVPVDDGSLTASIKDESTYCTSCILFLHVWKDSCSSPERFHDDFIKAFLFIVVILVMVLCAVIYYKVGKWYRRHEQVELYAPEGDGRSTRRFKRMFSTARNMVMVILICWTPVLVLIVMSILMTWTSIEQHSFFGLYILQAACVSIQGFLNSMVYAWRRPNFTDAVLGETTPLLTHNQLAFFEESLRASS